MPSNKKNTRMCCACREHADKSDMIRIVKSKDGKISVDESGCADGRGVWVHDSEECKSKLIKRKLLNSAFKTCIAEEIYEQIKSR